MRRGFPRRGHDREGGSPRARSRHDHPVCEPSELLAEVLVTRPSSSTNGAVIVYSSARLSRPRSLKTTAPLSLAEMRDLPASSLSASSTCSGGV